VFEHLNGLKERGHHPELWTLDQRNGPDWFDLDVPVRRFVDYGVLARVLGPVDAIKVATWWETAPAVWEAGLRRGIPLYFVQDIETSYYPTNREIHGRVLTAYRPEFTYLTTSRWVYDALLEKAPDATIISPGIDSSQFRDLGLKRGEEAVLALGRSNPLKDFPLTRASYLALPEPRPALWLFGIEPDLGADLGARYVLKPSDDGVNELFNMATVFLQTSKHEGFGLPILEAMSAGIPVVCTDADGNRDFCVDELNCLVPDRSPEGIATAIRRVLTDDNLRARLVAAGKQTAASYAWPRKLDELEMFYRELAVSRAGRDTREVAS